MRETKETIRNEIMSIATWLDFFGDVCIFFVLKLFTRCSKAQLANCSGQSKIQRYWLRFVEVVRKGKWREMGAEKYGNALSLRFVFPMPSRSWAGQGSRLQSRLTSSFSIIYLKWESICTHNPLRQGIRRKPSFLFYSDFSFLVAASMCWPRGLQHRGNLQALRSFATDLPLLNQSHIKPHIDASHNRRLRASARAPGSSDAYWWYREYPTAKELLSLKSNPLTSLVAIVITAASD